MKTKFTFIILIRNMFGEMAAAKIDIFQKILVHKLRYHFLWGVGLANDNMGGGAKNPGNMDKVIYG